jgi:glutamate-1-semialdehyde 2,1-aminomutase
MLRGIDRERLRAFRAEEIDLFARRRPRSRALTAGNSGYYAGVPLHWMLDWPLPFPLVVAEASGATLTDVDGHRLADFCLGDTGSMFGHSPAPIVRALTAQAARGLAYMLPTEPALEVGRLLAERFRLPYWQVATTASDANRFALRLARAVTGRAKILVMNGCYHGAVDETYVRLLAGQATHGPGLIGQFQDLTALTEVIEFNDVAALQRVLSAREVACVITEPVLTNCCMVLPDPDYHAALRSLTRATATLLLIDETHTISTGPSGYSGAHGLEPDIFVLGKPVAGGVPASVWGFTDDVARAWDRVRRETPPGHSGLGTTLSANALAMATMHATLSEVMTDAAYAHMNTLAARLCEGLGAVIGRSRLSWHAVRVGARVEFICAPGPLRNGTEAAAAHAPELEQALHLGLLNRGCVIAPFHNMMLLCPATTAGQVDQLVGAFGEVLGALVG